MYLEFFKFNKNPFHITPDPDFLFLSSSHKEASASIFYGIEARKGFVAVTGEVGVGKTTILRSYLEGTDPERTRIVYIFHAALSFDKLLKQICSDLGIEAAGKDPAELVEILSLYLIDEYSKDHNVVLIIDEAQNMPVETLERLRMLSNLETSQDKLIQMILVGQPEFEAKLNLPELRQLKQRIAIRSRIEALTAEESIAYIHHRLMRASSFHNPVFTKKALRLIIKKANGIPRLINVLCDNALVTAFGYQRKPVDEKIIREVLRDFGVGKPRRGFSWKIIWVPAVVACFATAVFVAPSLLPWWGNHAPGPRSMRAGVSPPLPVTVKVTKPMTVRTVENVPGEKKEQAFTGADHNVETAQKPVTRLAAGGSKPFVKDISKGTKRAAAAGVDHKQKPVTKLAAGGPKPFVKDISSGSKRAAAVAVHPAAIHRSTGKSGTTPLTRPAAKGSKRASEVTSKIDSVPPEAPRQLSPLVSAVKSGRPVAVRKGDTVSKLLIRIYGRANADMLESFKRLNPQIKDINRLTVGQKILIPSYFRHRPGDGGTDPATPTGRDPKYSGGNGFKLKGIYLKDPFGY